MKKKGFTLVELLVVIAIIAMLLAILMPALGKVRQLAQRIMCGTNVGGIGKAMLTYATDDKYESYPIAGPSGTVWDYGTATADQAKCTWDWRVKAVPGSTGAVPTGNPCTTTPCQSTLSANLYLLIKFADVTPDQYICPGSDEKKFDISLYTIPSTGYGQAFPDFWDFGSYDKLVAGKSRGRGHNSYSYQLPMVPMNATVTGAYPITGTTNPQKAILADRSPYWDAVNAGNATLYCWDTTNGQVKNDSLSKGNTVYHQKDGQNVLFVDQHVRFEKGANCAIEQDNIYTTWKVAASGLPSAALDKARVKQVGGIECSTNSGDDPSPTKGTQADDYPQDADDSFLVSDYN